MSVLVCGSFDEDLPVAVGDHDGAVDGDVSASSVDGKLVNGSALAFGSGADSDGPEVDDGGLATSGVSVDGDGRVVSSLPVSPVDSQVSQSAGDRLVWCRGQAYPELRNRREVELRQLATVLDDIQVRLIDEVHFAANEILATAFEDLTEFVRSESPCSFEIVNRIDDVAKSVRDQAVNILRVCIDGQMSIDLGLKVTGYGLHVSDPFTSPLTDDEGSN